MCVRVVYHILTQMMPQDRKMLSTLLLPLSSREISHCVCMCVCVNVLSKYYCIIKVPLQTRSLTV